MKESLIQKYKNYEKESVDPRQLMKEKAKEKTLAQLPQFAK